MAAQLGPFLDRSRRRRRAGRRVRSSGPLADRAGPAVLRLGCRTANRRSSARACGPERGDRVLGPWHGAPGHHPARPVCGLRGLPPRCGMHHGTVRQAGRRDRARKARPGRGGGGLRPPACHPPEARALAYRLREIGLDVPTAAVVLLSHAAKVYGADIVDDFACLAPDVVETTRTPTRAWSWPYAASLPTPWWTSLASSTPTSWR